MTDIHEQIRVSILEFEGAETQEPATSLHAEVHEQVTLDIWSKVAHATTYHRALRDSIAQFIKRK